MDNTAILEPFKLTQDNSTSVWEVAYWARELRHNKSIVISCKVSEVDTFLDKLAAFTGKVSQSTMSKSSAEMTLRITM